ncbi:MAG: arsenate-mycothiol transferase ArsC [Deltaproteobacteria bacterium]
MTTVLFACVENAGRSQLARAFFLAEADPLKARALSAGTQPAARVHPEVQAALRELGLELGEVAPRLLTAELAGEAQLLVTMGCGADCPVLPGLRREDWPIEDPKGKPPERLRAIALDLHERVRALVRENGWGR